MHKLIVAGRRAGTDSQTKIAVVDRLMLTRTPDDLEVGGFGQDLQFPVCGKLHELGTPFHKEWKESGELGSKDCECSEGMVQRCTFYKKQVGDGENWSWSQECSTKLKRWETVMMRTVLVF